MDLAIARRRALVLSSSRGLGLGVAEALAAEGVNVMLCGRSADRLAAAVQAINARGQGRAAFVRADLADDDFVDTVMGAAEAELGGIDILVNNTGGPPPCTALEIELDQLRLQFTLLVERVIALTARVLPGMAAQGWGRVLTIASTGVVQPIPTIALSNTLRSALVGWSKTLAGEVADDGITVNMLLPGRIATDRTEQIDNAVAERTGKSIEDVRDAALATIPARRYGEVKEFAAVAAFLCSAPASYVTGSLIRCDGGAIRSV